MGRPELGAPEIFSDMKTKALRCLESKEVLKRLVVAFCADCATKASGPLRDSETYKAKHKSLGSELGKAAAILLEKPNDAEAELRVSELRRRLATANRDFQAAYRCSREWVEIGEQVGLLLSQELGG